MVSRMTRMFCTDYLSIHDDETNENYSVLEKQISIIESGRLKCNLRIFGLDETETVIK